MKTIIIFVVVIFFSTALLSKTNTVRIGNPAVETATEIQLQLIPGGSSINPGLDGFSDSFHEDTLELEKWMTEPEGWLKENN